MANKDIQLTRLIRNMGRPSSKDEEKFLSRNTNENFNGFRLPHKRFVSMSSIADAAMGEPVLVDNKVHSLALRLGCKYYEHPELSSLYFNEIAQNNLGEWVPVGTPPAGDLNDITANKMVPMRVVSQINFGADFLEQTSPIAQQQLIDYIMKSQAAALDDALFNGDGVNAPKGIFENATVPVLRASADGGAITNDFLAQMEESVYTRGMLNDEDPGKPAFAMSAKGRKHLRTTPLQTNESAPFARTSKGYFYYGYPYAVTDAIANDITVGTTNNTTSLLMGDFSRVFISNFGGGLDILTDPYTLRKSNKITVIVTGYYDIFIIEPERFSIFEGIPTV